MERIKISEVRYYTELCNYYLDDCNKITLSKRYGYYAIYFINNNTLRTGLSLRQAYDIVYSLYTVLMNENYIKECKKEQLETEVL